MGLLLLTSGILLYRRNRIGKYIWWVCCPVVLMQVPIGTLLGAFVFIYLGHEDSKIALRGDAVPPRLPMPNKTVVGNRGKG